MHETDVLYLYPNFSGRDMAEWGADHKATLITGHWSLLLCLTRHKLPMQSVSSTDMAAALRGDMTFSPMTVIRVYTVRLLRNLAHRR